jgi:mRNA interferase MazF
MMPVLRGDVWWVSLDPTQGAKIQKTRPCLVLTSDILNRFRQTVVGVPLSTSARAHPPISVAVTCQGKPVVAIIDQIRSVSRQRLKSKIETASPAMLRAVSKALAEILELG